MSSWNSHIQFWTQIFFSAVVVALVWLVAVLLQKKNCPVSETTKNLSIRQVVAGKTIDDEKMSQGRSMMAHLDLARVKLAEGKGPEALQIVMQVIRATKGDAAMFDTLNRMKHQIDQHEAAEAGANQLCAQLEESCFIDEDSIEEAERLCRILENQDTILSERGQEDILRDAFEDGSSVVCTNCGDLISRARWRAHLDKWCSKLPHNAGDDMDIDVDSD